MSHDLTTARPIIKNVDLLRISLQILLMSGIFALLAYGGIALTRGDGRIATLWLPNAVLAGVLLRMRSNSGTLLVVGCAIVNFLVNLLLLDGVLTALALVLANAVEVMLFVWAMQRLCGHNPAMDRLANLGVLLLACCAAPVISSIIAGFALAPEFGRFDANAFLPWILADGLSLMIVTPIVMIGIDVWRTRRRPSGREAIEWGLFVAGTILGAALLFMQSRFPFLFLAAPLVIVAAFRTSIAGTALSVLMISVVASVATYLGHGPIMLVAGGVHEKLLTLQLFLATIFAIGLPVAAALSGSAAIMRNLAGSEELNRSILDNMREIIFKTDAYGRWIFLNPAWQDFTGYSVDESLGWSTTRLLHPEDLEAARQAYPALVSGEVEECTLRQRFFHKSGELRYIDVSMRRLNNERGDFTGTTGNIRDVTEIVRNARHLAESEARFRRMAEAAPVGIFCADAKGSVTYVNRAWSEKIGLTVEQALGDGWMSALADRPLYEESPPWTGFERPGDIRRRIVRFRSSTGGDMWVETVNSPEFDEDGRISGFIGAVIDITEQRNATEKLRESERRFQALANLAPTGIFRTDTDGNCTYVNAAWLRITALREGEWENDGWARALHPDDRIRVFESWSEAVRERRDFRSEFRFEHPDGTSAWVDVLGRPEIADDGGVLGFIGVTIDITERRKMEEELNAREAQLTLLANNATDAVFRLALDGCCLYASPSARSLLEIDPAKLIGAQMIDRFHPEDAPLVADAFADLGAGRVENCLIAYRSERLRFPGEFRWLEANCGLVRDPETGEPREVIASIRDVSATKALEQDLTLARERAEEAALAKSAFLANMSHEIRTPMNGVIGFTELLLADDLGDVQRNQIQLIAESGRAMMRLLNDILDMSKIEAGQMRIANEPVDLRHMIRSSARLMEPVARSKHLDLIIDVEDAIPQRILGDPLRIRQILLNLIGNAVKFTEQGSVRVRAGVESGESDTMLRFDVEDTGVGIPAERLEHIFQQFTQADDSIARRFGGSGLGLTISSQLAGLMGGAIEVSSELGKGTVFMVRLPLRLPDTRIEPSSERSIARPQRGVSGSAPRVLIAEDHDINQELILAMARRAGMAPSLAADGAQAVAMVLQAAESGTPFDLVLMDIQMPVIDGLQATRQLRRQGITPDVLPIVALTANAYAEDVSACLAAGMQAHMSKPVRLRDLRDILSRFVPRTDMPSATGATEPAPERSLAARYNERKRDTLETIGSLVRQGSLTDEEVNAAASMLHKLAGTAGMFGEAGLGDVASECEHVLLQAPRVGQVAAMEACLQRLLQVV
jgi:PAS domain S-box-containing protein